MVNTVTNAAPIVAGTERIVQYVCIDSDGSEETDLVIYDSSAIATLIKKADSLKCRINSITYSTNSVLGVVHLEFDASTDVLAWALPCQNSGHFCFEKHGGLVNRAGSGITGDITLTTTGLVAGDKVTLVIDVRPY